MFASEKEQRQRMKVCLACPLFNNGWCGEPLVGTLVDNPYGGRRKRTCGCNMKLKVKLSWVECGHPFNKKWGKVAEKDPEMIKQVGELLAEIGDAITPEQKDRLFTFKDKITGSKTRNKQTTCPACLRDAISQLRKAYKQLNQ